MNLFIFFRDFRIQDNIGLQKATNKSGKIVPIFCFTPEQIDEKKNKYFSNNSLQFLCECLNDLRQNINKEGGELYIFYSNLIKLLESIYRTETIESIHFNMDYTPYAKKRTLLIESFCKKLGIKCFIYEDYLLGPIGSFLKPNSQPYTVYTPFKNNVYDKKDLIPRVSRWRSFSFMKKNSLKSMKESEYDLRKFYTQNSQAHVHGGRKVAQALLTRAKSLSYDNNRNELSFETTNLSAFIKYGCVSIREVFHKLHERKQGGICDQLIWREFYFYVAYYFPEVLSRSRNFQSKYDKIKWVTNKKWFNAWCDGRTGYPVVDACMMQLNKTGYMHNRGRLITSNFLNRILGMDWRLGERYFAQKLIDYDPCVNNGNWQWIASTGTDPKPYFQRLFNPWLQSKKFDSDAKYIKTWLPQLKDIPAQDLHDWENVYKDYDIEYSLKNLNYYAPIIDYKKARERSISQYRL